GLARNYNRPEQDVSRAHRLECCESAQHECDFAQGAHLAPMASQSTTGFRRRQTRTGVVYEIDKGATEMACRFVLMVVGWIVAFILCLAVWLGVWHWLGGENVAEPRVARPAYWIGLAAGIVAAIPVLLLFRWLWRRIGASFSLSQQGVTKGRRLITWAELENL